jgi:hypothetical protein
MGLLGFMKNLKDVLEFCWSIRVENLSIQWENYSEIFKQTKINIKISGFSLEMF